MFFQNLEPRLSQVREKVKDTKKDVSVRPALPCATLYRPIWLTCLFSEP